MELSLFFGIVKKTYQAAHLSHFPWSLNKAKLLLNNHNGSYAKVKAAQKSNRKAFIVARATAT